MNQDALGKRQKALEEQFFRHKDQQLLDQLKSQLEKGSISDGHNH